jgi:hypothetical protein
MTMYFSKSTGGFYDDSIHTAAQIPSDAVVITTTVWQDMLAGQAAGDTISADSNGNPILVPPPTPTLAQVQAAAYVTIDQAAETLRAVYITANSGQVATYLMKYNEATAFTASNYEGTIPGLVQAEMTATGATAEVATQAILTQYNTWAALAASIETVRRTAKIAVAAAPDAPTVQTAVTTATTGFSQIQTAAGTPSPD